MLPESLVSVIVPCYNQAQYLPDALNSVLSQTYGNWECIIVNDGSPDNTEQVSIEWVAKDARFSYLKKGNGGLSSARNAGLKVAKGRFIQFLDADDLILPDKIALQVTQLNNLDGLCLSICDYYCCDINDSSKVDNRQLPLKFRSCHPLEDLIMHWEIELSIPVHCFLFDARIFKEHAIFFDESLRTHEDWDCWMRVFCLQPSVRYSDQLMAIYRVNRCSMCSNKVTMRQGYLKALKKHRKLFKNNPDLTRLIMFKILDVKKSSRDAAPKMRILNAARSVLGVIIPNRTKLCLKHVIIKAISHLELCSGLAKANRYKGLLALLTKLRRYVISRDMTSH